MSTVEKRCSVCNDDVANKKRVKDPKGRYLCDPCYQAKRADKPAPVGAGASVAAAAFTAPPADDGLLDLAPVEAPKKENMFGCAGCKKLVPERQIRNVDGDFLCGSCVAKIGKPGKPAAKSRPSPAKAKPNEPQDEDNAERWYHSLGGSAIICLVLLAVAFGCYFGLHMVYPYSKEFTGAGPSALYAVVNTIFLLFRTVGLLASMVLAAKILGGISFGYLGPTVYKSIGVLTAYTCLEIWADHTDLGMMMGYSFKGIILIMACIVVFKIDYFEAMLVTVINFFINIALFIAMIGAFISIANSLGGASIGHDKEDDFNPKMNHINPAHPGKDDEEDAPPVVDKPKPEAPVVAPAPAE